MKAIQENYDLYKVYGIFKLLQEKNRLMEKLVEEIETELNIPKDWIPNIDLHYNIDDITIKDVKEFCEEYFNKK